MAAPIPGPPWTATFIAALASKRRVGKAIEAAGKAPGTVYAQKRRNKLFAEAWEQALAGNTDAVAEEGSDPASHPAPNGGWQTPFLECLAATSCVSAAATKANVPPSTVYRLRQKDHEFALRWRTALHEGYENLEMELLGYLRAEKPDRKMDVAGALRLLAFHREAVVQERAVRANVSVAEVRASIERKVQVLRERVLAERELP